MTQVQQRELVSVVSCGAPNGSSMLLAVTPFNSSPQTPRGMKLVAELQANSTLRGCLERSPQVQWQEPSSHNTTRTVAASQPSSPTRMAASQASVLTSVRQHGGAPGRASRAPAAGSSGRGRPPCSSRGAAHAGCCSRRAGRLGARVATHVEPAMLAAHGLGPDGPLGAQPCTAALAARVQPALSAPTLHVAPAVLSLI